MNAPARALICSMNALTAEQRARHADATRRLLAHATRTDLDDGFACAIDRDVMSVANVADESRCCPSLDFHVELPALGPIALRIGGGADGKAFIAAELGLCAR